MDSLAAKTCTKCGERKLLTEYTKKSSSKDGTRSCCRACEANQRKIYRELNRDQVLITQQTWRESHVEYRRGYREKTKEHNSSIAASYRKRFPEKIRARARVRRARKLQNGVEPYTEAQVLETYGTACHLCTKEVNLEAPRRSGAHGWEDGLHIDHIVPISKGGPDTLDNVRPAHGSCNIKKGDRI
jgi:5-methylcytosine-specific restriction endonuclease McrA